jgi:uridine phosphorylase
MLYTHITQDCISVDTADGMRYQITTTVIDDPIEHYGELPDPFLFVYDVVEALDPKQDVFVRVGSPYDLENVVVGRAATITAGTLRYRTNSFMVRYTDLEIAVQAKQAIKQRVDTAVMTWYTYKSAFYALLETTEHPTTDEEYIQTLTNAYVAARDARIAAEAAAVTASTAVATALVEANAAAQMVQIYYNEVAFCQTGRVTYWLGTPGVKSGVSNLSTASNTFFTEIRAAYDAHSGFVYPASPPGTSDWHEVHEALVDMELALGTWATAYPFVNLLDTLFATFCSGANNGYMTAVNTKNSKDLAVANAQTAKEKADASVATAQAAEDAALAAVRAACPTFDPSTV